MLRSTTRPKPTIESDPDQGSTSEERRLPRRPRESWLPLTAFECAGLIAWVLLYREGEKAWAYAALVAGETLESGVLVALLRDKQGLSERELNRPGVRSHLRTVRAKAAIAIPAEIGLWIATLAIFATAGWLAAGVFLLVLMHLKHQLEASAVFGHSFFRRPFRLRVIVANLSEVAGGIGMLVLARADEPWLAGAAIVGGIGYEHWLLIGAANAELKRRDLRLPRPLDGESRYRRPGWQRNGLANTIELWAASHLSWLWWVLARPGPTRRIANRQIINRLAYKLPTRPDRLATRDSYTSWTSLEDRSWSSRHADPVYNPQLPEPDRVVRLFERNGSETRLSEKSTLLFPHFAQWFTDGFLRTDPNDVRKNTSTHEIDLSQLYGQTDDVTSMLRGERGRLRSQLINGLEYPPYYVGADGRVDPQFAELPLDFRPETDDRKGPRNRLDDPLWHRLFALGIPRGNIHYGFVMMSTLFLREHNRLAGRLAAENPDWDSDRIFATARMTLTVILLKVVVQDYINHIAPFKFRLYVEPGIGETKKWFRENRMAIEFDLLYRWHALVPARVRAGGRVRYVQDLLWDTTLVTDHGIGPLFDEASRQPCAELTLFNTPQFLLDVERKAVEIGRDVKLAGYNHYRRRAGYPALKSFSDLSSDSQVQRALAERYATIEDVEFYVGLLAEDVFPGAALPTLMGTMVGVDAFTQALTNKLLATTIFTWQTFSRAGMEEIEKTQTLFDVVQRNTRDEGCEPFVSFTRTTWSGRTPPHPPCFPQDEYWLSDATDARRRYELRADGVPVKVSRGVRSWRRHE